MVVNGPDVDLLGLLGVDGLHEGRLVAEAKVSDEHVASHGEADLALQKVVPLNFLVGAVGVCEQVVNSKSPK